MRDTDLQPRQKLNEQAIRRYQNAYKSGSDMPPIIVAEVDGALLLVDGWHRTEAMERAGHIDTEAEVILGATYEQAGWEAAKANLAHGVQLKAAELRNAFRAYVKAGKHVKQLGRNGAHIQYKSYRDIERDFNAARSFVTYRNWMKQDFPKIAAQMGGEGAGEGGLQEKPSKDERFAALAQKALEAAAAAAAGVTCARLRGHLVEEAQRTLEAIREGGRWDPLEEDSDY